MQAASAHCKPKKVTVTVGVEETVGKLKEQVIGSVIDESVWGNPLSTYVVAEVVNNSICRLLVSDSDILLHYTTVYCLARCNFLTCCFAIRMTKLL